MKSLEQVLRDSNRLASLTAGELISKIRMHIECIEALSDRLKITADERDALSEALDLERSEVTRLRLLVVAKDELIEAYKRRGIRLMGVAGETPNGLTHKTQAG